MAHFFKPPSPQVVKTFRIPLGDTWDLALWGIDKNTGDLKPIVKDDQVAAAFLSPFPPQGGVLKFALQALKLGSTKLEGKNAQGSSWAEAEIVVIQPVEPKAVFSGSDQEVLEPGPDYRVFPNYIDKVKGGHYDVGSDNFTVDHEDGTTIDLPYGRILSDVQTAKTPGSGPPGSRTVSGLYGFVRNVRTQKIYPLQFNETTTPNLAAMVLETESVVQGSKAFFEISKAFLQIIAVYAQVKMASGGVRPGWKVVAGKGPSGRPKLSPNIIQGDPPTVKIGKFGEPGNLFGGVEVSAGSKVVYRVDAIVLKGEGNAADLATARLAHREMIVRAAQKAQRAGQKQFAFRGIQANPNFCAHADALASEVGVPNSGKVLGGTGAYSNYEVILDVAKVLASQ
jgi:hypothetical protein